MLAWFEDEMGALPRNPGDYDIISMTAPLGELCGDAARADADRKVFLALYFMTERFMQSLMPIADEDSPLFRMLTTTAAKRHPVRRVNAPDPNKELMLDPSRTIGEVAYELGFQYPQHFTRMFKKLTGQTPNAFRAVN